MTAGLEHREKIRFTALFPQVVAGRIGAAACRDSPAHAGIGHLRGGFSMASRGLSFAATVIVRSAHGNWGQQVTVPN